MNEAGEYKGQVVTRIEAMPKCARDESSHTGAESRFLAFRGDSKVDIVSKPVVGIDVPASEICSGVLRTFDTPRTDILEPIP